MEGFSHECGKKSTPLCGNAAEHGQGRIAEAERRATMRDMHARNLYLGIEGGGTRSTLVLADERGNAVAELQGGPANVKLLGDRQLLWLLRSFATRLPKVDGSLAAIAIGLAGARSDSDKDRIRRAAARVWPQVPCIATNDLETALAAAPASAKASARVLILSGTGSCCFGRANDGREARVGGRGHVIGDRGSACDIGQRALKGLMAEYDHTNRWPKLGGLILQSLLLNDPEDLIPWSMEVGKTEIASLALSVFTAAKQRDPLAIKLLRDAANALAEDGNACAERLCKRGEIVEFVFNGGVLLKNTGFARDVARRLRAKWPKCLITHVKRSSSWGAVELAKSLKPGALITNKRPLLPATLPADHPAFDRTLLQSSPTEQRNPRSIHLDTMPLPRAIELMLSEEEAVANALRRERAGIAWVVERVIESFKHAGHLYYVGAGTSGRLGVLDASECPPTFRAPREQVQGIIAGGQQALWSAVEGAEDDANGGARAIEHRSVGKRDVVVGIAASGRTPFVWGALAEASKHGATTVLVCFNPGYKKLRRRDGIFMPDKIIAPNLGPEVLTGSTRLKSGTATKLILNILTTLAMTHSGKVISNLMVDLNPSNEKLRVRAVGIVRDLTGCDADVARATLEACGWVVKDAWQQLRKH
jgi:N-acetylmuramic acid 6-phosphate etherase